MEEKLLTYGLQDGAMKHISEVESGMACNCRCPSCQELLVAKNKPTSKRAAHFTHTSRGGCTGANESVLRLLAKEVLRDQKSLWLPDYHTDYNRQNYFSFYRSGGLLQFEDVKLDQEISRESVVVIADAIGYWGSRQVVLEFTHARLAGNEKIEKIKMLDVPCIEIDLTDVSLDREELRRFFANPSNVINWVINPHLDNVCERQEEVGSPMPEMNLPKSSDEEREAFSRARYENYAKERIYGFLPLKGGFAFKCPIVLERLSKFRSEPLYDDPLLKAIIDGEVWDGMRKRGFDNPRGVYIEFGGQKIIIEQPYPERLQLSAIEANQERRLNAGLLLISLALKDYRGCIGCQFKESIEWFDGKHLVVCSHNEKSRSNKKAGLRTDQPL